MHRFHDMSEQYWNRIHAPHKADKPQHHPNGGGQPHHAGDKTGQGVVLARRHFDGRDRSRTGYLDISVLLSLAEEIWAAEHPGLPLLGRDSIKVQCLIQLDSTMRN